MRRFLLLLLSCVIIACAADNISAAKPKRTSKSVKKERRMTANEVERTRKQISQNTAETRRQLNRLQSLTAETRRCEKSITDLSSRITTLDRRIKEMDDSIVMMERKLTLLKDAYANNLREMRARRQLMSETSILLSSGSFTEAYRRYRYLREFEKWQKEKTLQIRDITDLLTSRRKNVAEARQTQAKARTSLTKEKERLTTNQQETEKVVANLRSQGTSLKKVLDEKQQQLKQLDNELDRIIAEEARRAEEARIAEEKRLAEEARRKAEEARRAEEEKKKAQEQATPERKENSEPSDNSKRTEKPATATPQPLPQPQPSKSELIALSGTFEANKGKMPAPVTGRYAIVSHFGLNSHPDISNIKINNSGIDLETAPGASARAVFDGEVSSVFRVSGYQNVVMLRHGNYLTVYAGIDALSVKKGDKVKAGQTLGTVYADSDDNGRCVLHFEVRRERTKLNPEEWIK